MDRVPQWGSDGARRSILSETGKISRNAVPAPLTLPLLPLHIITTKCPVPRFTGSKSTLSPAFAFLVPINSSFFAVCHADQIISLILRALNGAESLSWKTCQRCSWHQEGTPDERVQWREQKWRQYEQRLGSVIRVTNTSNCPSSMLIYHIPQALNKLVPERSQYLVETIIQLL